MKQETIYCTPALMELRLVSRRMLMSSLEGASEGYGSESGSYGSSQLTEGYDSEEGVW